MYRIEFNAWLCIGSHRQWQRGPDLMQIILKLLSYIQNTTSRNIGYYMYFLDKQILIKIGNGCLFQNTRVLAFLCLQETNSRSIVCYCHDYQNIMKVGNGCFFQKSIWSLAFIESDHYIIFCFSLSQFRHMSYTNRTRTSMEDGEFNINPEPVPYQPQNFM